MLKILTRLPRVIFTPGTAPPHLRHLGLLLHTTARLPGVEPPGPGDHHPVPRVLPRVQGGPHVQQRELVVVRIHRPAVVVVYDVADFLAAPVYDPVMTVERQLIPGGGGGGGEDDG